MNTLYRAGIVRLSHGSTLVFLLGSLAVNVAGLLGEAKQKRRAGGC